MTSPKAPVPSRSVALSALCASAVVLTLAGCGGPAQPPEEVPSAGVPSTPPTSPSTSPSASPSPVAPSDGTDLAACSDGDCEVEVTAPAEVDLDPEFAIDTLTIDSITDGSLAFTMTSTAGEVSFGCQNSDSAPCDSSLQGTFGPGGAATGQATGGPGAQVGLNDLVLEVVDVSGDSAIMRIAPA
ncbi:MULTISPECIES: hypothetical protein [Nocardiopsidaceae]|uniref:Lipoprotein n=1 Tax=Streptomonospora nanhaiensis TaxID=1323731 RepID=A0ABY6YFT9_9ACTN|nr:hypothetical protein [Streptomonospora nanhaiensis]WAE71076.1 hypothetical protein OUQ99_17735 [Streptomonospora nanhaiensis]